MSKQVPILKGRVESEQIQWHGIDGKRYQTLVRHLEGQDFELTIQKLRKKRSLNQNAYYFAVIVAMIAEAAGYTPEEAHDALRLHFLQQHTESRMPTVRSTTSLSTAEAEEYFSQCRQLGAEMYGIYIPEPNEVAITA